MSYDFCVHSSSILWFVFNARTSQTRHCKGRFRFWMLRVDICLSPFAAGLLKGCAHGQGIWMEGSHGSSILPHVSWSVCIWHCQLPSEVSRLCGRFPLHCDLHLWWTPPPSLAILLPLLLGWSGTGEKVIIWKTKQTYLFITCVPSFLSFLGSSLNSEFGDYNMAEVKCLWIKKRDDI